MVAFMDPEAKAREHIARLTEIFARATERKPGGILARAANDARFLDRTKDGAATFTFRVYRVALRWFFENWPEDLAWPEDIPRPTAADGMLAQPDENGAEPEPCA